MSIVSILEVCRTIKHDRNIKSAFKHLGGEIEELSVEISSSLFDRKPGVDGVIGEAVDCILCLVDIIYQENNSITPYEINKVIHDKLGKWKRVYSDNPPLVKTQAEKDCESINQGNKFYSQDNF